MWRKIAEEPERAKSNRSGRRNAYRSGLGILINAIVGHTNVIKSHLQDAEKYVES
jgi:hypothetical protein